MPATMWCPLLLATLLPLLLVLVQVRTRARSNLARRVASTVALQVSVGFAALVVATAMVVFRTGLVNLSTPSPDDLALLALDIERVRQATAGDEPSLRGRLALLDAVDARTAWSLVSHVNCSGRACVIAVSPRLSRAEGVRLQTLARAHTNGVAWPVSVSGRVAKVVAVPLRDQGGTPDAFLLIGFDARQVASQATIASWVSLSVLVGFWALIVLGMQRAVGLLVSDRLTKLASVLSSAPPDHVPSRPPDVAVGDDEMRVLAMAIESVAERSVRQQTQFRTLVEHAPVGIARVDETGKIITANPRFLRLLSVSVGGSPPPWTEIFTMDAERTLFLHAIAGSDPLSSVLWTWKDCTARMRVVRASTVPLPGSETEAGAVLLVEDVTEQRALESQLQRSQKVELVGRLAGGIAHDFNNMLTVVRGNVSALGGVTASPELGAIDDAAARGARLVRRLLTISRHDHLTLSATPPGPLVHDAIEMVRRVLPARISVEAPLQVPDVMLLVDRDAVEQSLLNLALNARDAIEGNGTLRVEAQQVRGPGGAGSLVLSLEDDGAGMPDDVLARATEPFFSTKSPERGTGLGLTVVNSTMEWMGGRLELRSTQGSGTRAELWFPISAESDGHALAATRAAVDADASPGLRVLLVDDELAVRVATERALRVFGHAVSTASNMTEALALLATDASFDLVVSDVMMPGGTGIDLLRAVRAAGSTLPFLFVSGYAMESLEGILEGDRRTSMLTKPWSTRDLEVKLRETAATLGYQ
jgi:signal transduction histidine kinase/CheY-like chemotaxis protein